METNKIILGDCLEVMQQIPDESIDMILCDLPYGVTARNKWDVVIPFVPLWEQYKRVSKDNAAIVLTATQPFASELILSNRKMFRYDLIWEKNKSTGFLNANKMPLRNHEHILVFYRKLPTYNSQKTTGHKPVNSFTKRDRSSNYGKQIDVMSGGGSTERHPKSVLKFKVENNDSPEKFHPTQKPVEMFSWLIKTFTNPGDVVLDNCIGSGTTAVACLETSRKFIGIEMDEKYHELACERVERML